jgi:quercetin dioxygenase-like cupin family protein
MWHRVMDHHEPATFPPRRVVTGHDAQGRARVVADETVDNATVRRPGHRSYVLWATDEVPADAEAAFDPALAPRSLQHGTVFRIVEYGPGVAPARHRTDSVDYAVVLTGEIDLVLDGETVRLRAGDTLVQRATAHDWHNPTDAPCVVAFCLVGARSGS